MEKISDTKVKVFTNTSAGVPLLNAEWGSLNDILKATLVDGTNEKTITQLSYDSSKKELTLEGEVSGYVVDSVIKITGHSNTKVNQEFRVVSRNSNTSITVLAKEDLGSVGSESVTVKLAPLGYTLAYDDIATTGTACYKNTDPEYPAILKVIDKVPPNDYNTDWVKFGRVVVGERIDGEGNFIDEVKTPKHPQYPDAEKTGNGVSGAGGIHGYAKWYYTFAWQSNALEAHVQAKNMWPTRWVIIGDSNTFYLIVQSMGNHTADYYQLYGFGLYDDLGLKKSIFLNASDNFRAANHNKGYTEYSAYCNSFTLFNNFSNIHGLFLFQMQTGEYATVNNIVAGRPCLTFSSGNYPQLWSNINFTNPLTGNCLIEKVYLASYNVEKAFRGNLRGIRVPIGYNNFSHGLRFKEYYCVNLRSDQRDVVWGYNTFFLISLKDWD